MASPKCMSHVVHKLITFLQTRDHFGTNQGVKSLKPIWKYLYTLLSSLASYEVRQGNCSNGSSRNSFNLELEDTVTLSVVLFKELHERLLACSDNASVDRDVELEGINVNEKDSREEFLLLLRCCVLLVRLNPYDQILTDQFQDAVALLHKLCAQGRLSKKERKPTNDDNANSDSLDFSAKSPNLYVRFLQQMLEVYLDELFADRPFRECITFSESVTLTCQNWSVCSSIQIESVLEIVAAHFLLLISGRNFLETFTESLIWTEDSMLSSPEVSLRVVSSLMNHPVMTSAPTLLFPHLISLASEVIGIGVPDVRCGNIYLSTFCDSVSLYCNHMSKLTDFSSPGKNVQSLYQSHFQSEIYQRINFMLVILDNNWKAQSGSICKKMTAITENDAISYITTNIKIVDESYRNNVFTFLSLLISKVVSVEMSGRLLQSVEDMTKQDHCLLASILKLMSCSLLQATHCFKKNLSSLIALMKRKDAHPVCNSQGGLMGFFSLCNLDAPIEVQQVVVDALKPHLSTCKEFASIVVHFAGLLSVCIFHGLDMLVKGCLFLMLVLLNTLALELGSLEFLSTSVAAKSKSCVRPTSSLRLASNFRRERRKLLRNPTRSEVIDGETCNGEIYLRYLIGNPKTIDDYDELADFIECKPYRDYEARVSFRLKRQYRRYHKYTRRLRSAMMQAYGSVRSGSKRKETKKSCERSKYLKVK